MTAKHFRLFAMALRGSKPQNDAVRLTQWQHDVNGIALVCAMQNPRFDMDKFLAACGFTETAEV